LSLIPIAAYSTDHFYAKDKQYRVDFWVLVAEA